MATAPGFGIAERVIRTIAPDSSLPLALKAQVLKRTLANAHDRPERLRLEVGLDVSDAEVDAALSGKVLREFIADLNLQPDVGEKFVAQISKQAKADGLDLTEEEATNLANLLLLVGKKFADEF